MFVQHMLASLKTDGHMATIMPHGVLFRGGKEKLIRELFIKDDVIEAIISLPPGLFYGTGIPACVLVMNKNKPDAMRGKVLFINADREYAEGKNQNKLRPEDIEKIDFVFTHKRELPKYSRLVDKDGNRREARLQPQHPPLCGQYARPGAGGRAGPPHRRRAGGGSRRPDRATSLSSASRQQTLFQPNDPAILPFVRLSRPSRHQDHAGSRSRAPEDLAAHHEALEAWWDVARDDFAQLRDGKKMPEVRHELLTTIKSKLVPLGVLDEFKSAGVFVNWWQQIRYDLKTIVSTGWHHTLIPDAYLIAAFFQAEADAIEALEAKISEAQSELAEAVETAQEVAAYEPEEDETVTAAVIKKALKELIDDLRAAR